MKEAILEDFDLESIIDAWAELDPDVEGNPYIICPASKINEIIDTLHLDWIAEHSEYKRYIGTVIGIPIYWDKEAEKVTLYI